MTVADTVNNIILDKGGTNEVTVYTTRVEEILNKKITKIMPPQSTANWAAGVKPTKIIDLLRMEHRFAVKAMFTASDKSKLKAILKAGGVFTMEYESEDFEINIEKMLLVKDERENAERLIDFTAVVGVNI